MRFGLIPVKELAQAKARLAPVLDAAARLLRRLGPRQVVAGVLAVTDDPARRAAANLPRVTP